MLVRILPLFLLACADGPPEASPTVDPGAIAGRACAPASRTWAPGAVVTVESLDLVTTADADGRFTLANLPGDAEYTFTVQVGVDIVDTYTVWVAAGDTVALEEPACLDAFTQDVLVITGPGSEAVAALEQVAITTVTTLDGSDTAAVSALLDDPTALGAYALVVFEGGFVEAGVIHDVTDPTNVAVAARMQNIRDFVDAGGVVFATERAYDVAEIGWPDQANFAGADEIPDDAEMGVAEPVDALADNAALAAFVGASGVPVTYAAAWPPVLNLGDEASDLLRGDVSFEDGFSEYTLSAVPLLYRFLDGDGGVVFSTFPLTADASDELVETLRYTLHTR
ncbi:MAG: hypothetical protein V4850_29565 [Myxococcota bacterium]